MKIRTKLLLLLLVLSLLPLLVLGLISRRAMLSLGSDLAARSHASLEESARSELLEMLRERSALARRRVELLELALADQAAGVERALLREPDPELPVFFTTPGGFGEPGGRVLETSAPLRFEAAGAEPLAVSLDHPTFDLAPGVSAESVSRELAQLAALARLYRRVRAASPDLVYWQYTSLESGVHNVFPGHGGYPSEYDPRTREWYRLALASQTSIRTDPYVEVSTGHPVLTFARRVRRGAEIVGVTAIDVLVADLLEAVRPTAQLAANAQVLLIAYGENADPAGLRVLARPGLEAGSGWNEALEREYLSLDDARVAAELHRDLREGRADTLLVSADSGLELWVYGPLLGRGVALLARVPHADVVAQAENLLVYAHERTREELLTTAWVAIGVLGLALIAAIVASRSVTNPVAVLAEASTRLAAGDFAARADLDSSDELGELAVRFNSMVPQLHERLKLRESLALATEVQQQLLPDTPPQLDGVEIAGGSVYCDETGGDYVDYLSFAEWGGERVVIGVGDVTGHGLGAALLMCTVRGLLRGRLAPDADLGSVLADVNRRLAEDVSLGRFVTLFVLSLDARARSASWVSCGHDPALVLDPSSGAFSEVEGEGIPLGIEPLWRYEVQGPRALQKGEIWILGTDGIWESRNESGQQFGKERLCEVVRDHEQQSAQRIYEAVLAAVALHRGPAAQRDDLTLTILKV